LETANARAYAATVSSDAATAAAAEALPPAPLALFPAAAHPLKDLKIKLDKFVSCTDMKSVDTWLDSLDYCLATHNLTADADTPFMAQYHLDSESRDWFKLLVDSTGTKNNKAMRTSLSSSWSSPRCPST
jgi:hypothetical protein